MDIPLFEKLLQKQIITKTEFDNIVQQQTKPLSVYTDLTTLLYLGVLLFTGGAGILVYKNIDSIGHAAVISLVAVLCLVCFVYCFKKAAGYSHVKKESPAVLFDYVLLLGCLLLLTFIGYLQFACKVFGNQWGLATFIPMVLLFMAAYYFDHLGVLSMAITNLAAWAGFAVAPLQIIHNNDFRDEQLIYTALVLGGGLIAISFVSVSKQIKAHFAFTYKNFGTHILFIALLGALFHFDSIYFIWFLILSIAAVLFFKTAIQEKSFYFLVITVLYGFTGVSYVVCKLLWSMDAGEASFFLSFIYFIATGIGLIRLLIHYNKIFKEDADLQ